MELLKYVTLAMYLSILLSWDSKSSCMPLRSL